MTETLSEIWPAVESTAFGLGAMSVGGGPVEDPQAGLLEWWLDSGLHASMSWLEKNRDARVDHAVRFPWARSVIAVTVPYEPSHPGDGSAASAISRYAQGEDYHFVVDDLLAGIETEVARLAPGVRTRRYVDTGPLSDRALAAGAGLGWIGRNSMLIDERYGSWFFIGTLLTSLDCDLPVERVTDRCGTCTRCVEACPTDAILPERVVDSNRCISYLTIEHRGEIPGALADRLDGWVFGCDICQEVCPWNRRPAEGHPRLEPRSEYRNLRVEDLMDLSQEEFSILFRRSAVKRAKHEGIVRNARLATG